MLKLCQFIAWILTLLGRKRVIMDHLEQDKEYLWRHYLLGKREHKHFVVCLHKILRSDMDFLHSHPASYFAVVLTGGYWEYTISGRHWRGPGSMRFRCMDSFHRIVIDHDRPVWTLFIMFQRKDDWYFLVNGKAVPHEQHLGHKSP
jgi:hypothetical protein